MDTHSAGGELRGVVIHICHCDDGCGRVWETIVQISFHICGLHNDYVLLNFLEKKKKKEKEKMKDKERTLKNALVYFPYASVIFKQIKKLIG